MRVDRLSAVLILSIFVVSLAVPLSSPRSTTSGAGNGSYIAGDILPSNQDRLQDYRDGLHIRVYNTSVAMNGLNLFSLSIAPNITQRTYHGYLLITDMQGNIVNGFYSDEEIICPRMVNSTTVVYAPQQSKNITFWNWLTNKTVVTSINAGHHEFDYNPLTDQFVVFRGWREDYYNEAENKTYPVSYDDVVVYNREGSMAWTWSANKTFPFNYTEFSLRTEINRGEYDWMHTNSLFWDADKGAIYVSVRHLDCVVEINATTGTTDWVVGRYTGTADKFTLYNQRGEVVNSIFYHTHALEKTGPNSFVVFDNDFYNLTRGNPLLGQTMFVRFEVDEAAKTARVIWSWTAPESYFQNSQGNADLLPNGDVVGSFNNVPEPWFTEVDPNGNIVWEFMFNKTQDNAGFKAPAGAFERFVEKPIIKNPVYSEQITEGENVTLSMSVWDTFKRRYSSDAVIRVLEGDTQITTDGFVMLPFWQETQVSTAIPGLTVGSHNLTIEVVNADGVVTQLPITVVVNANILPYVGIAAAGIIIIAVVVYVWKKK